MDWIDPSDAREDGDVLTDAQVSSWRQQGFALVDGVIPSDLIDRVEADASSRVPAAGSPESERIRDFGAGGMQFPAGSEALNEITLHPRLLNATAQLLDVEVSALRLTQADLWPKYGRTSTDGARDNADQRIHVDYPNHTLTHPPRWEEPEAVELILYLTDVEECGGATRVVPRTGPDDPAYAWPITRTPGVGALEWVNDRSSAEEYLEREAPEVATWRKRHLYSREVAARYTVGTILFYRHDTWHRGTPLDPGSLRLVHNMTLRRAASEWVSVLHSGWAWAMYRRSRVMERLIATASVEQRCVLGFPAPGHTYWNAETLQGVTARYGPLGFDPTPYENSLVQVLPKP